MVSIDREAPPPGPVLTGFTENGFRCDGVEYTDGLWLTPQWARNWDAPALDALDPAGFEELLAIEPVPEFLLLGTGHALHRPAPSFVETLEDRGFGIEAMGSRAAARAWGVLRAEERQIVAALMPFTE